MGVSWRTGGLIILAARVQIPAPPPHSNYIPCRAASSTMYELALDSNGVQRSNIWEGVPRQSFLPVLLPHSEMLPKL